MRKIFAVLFLLAISASAQQLLPTKAQQARLVAEKKKLFKIQEQYLHLQVKMQSLQAEQGFHFAALDQMCHEIIVKNRWPLSTECDKQSLVFVERQNAPSQSAPVKDKITPPTDPRKP